MSLLLESCSSSSDTTTIPSIPQHLMKSSPSSNSHKSVALLSTTDGKVVNSIVGKIVADGLILEELHFTSTLTVESTNCAIASLAPPSEQQQKQQESCPTSIKLLNKKCKRQPNQSLKRKLSTLKKSIEEIDMTGGVVKKQLLAIHERYETGLGRLKGINDIAFADEFVLPEN